MASGGTVMVEIDMSGIARVALIDDHPLYRAGIRHVLDSTPDMEIVAEGSDAAEALEIAAVNGQDLMLMDINIPGGGIDAARAIANSHPGIKIVFLTNSESDANVSAVMQLGARGYIVKGISGAELVDILRLVKNGESYVTPSLGAQVLRNIGRCRSAVWPHGGMN